MKIERGKKLLLVEDEAITAKITAKMLKINGYDVIIASDGIKAVQIALTDTSIDLVLMDIDLGPGMNGTEAARRILETRNIPIVFLTSHSEQRVVEMVKEITRYGYVIKNSGDFVILSSIEMAFELFASHERLKESADYLRISEQRVRSKLDSILSPDGDAGELELEDIVDITMLQSIMDDFNALTDIGVAIVDINGKVLVATGWQDICTKFHRVNPDTCRNCFESDTTLSMDVASGTYKIYKCKNNMWDMSTPIEVGGKHVGNLFLGQFLFEDDVIDYDLFRGQARQYGFDEKEYIDALDRVPRWGRDTVHTVMTFYTKLSNIISKLSYSNIKLAKTLSERDRYSDLHKESEARLSDVTDYMVDLVASLDQEGFFKYVSPSYERVLGYRPEELIGTWPPDIFHPSTRNKNIKDILHICSAGEGSAEFRQRHKNGSYRWFEATGRHIYDENGVITGTVLGARDITQRKITEKKLSRKDKQYKELFESMLDGFALHEIIVDDWGNPVDYIFLEVNPAFERYTGLRAADIVGKGVSDIMPDIEPFWLKTYGQVAFSGVQLTIENFSNTLNKWFKVTAYSPERGYFATIFEDITDRKKGEQLIKEKDERYKRLFESVVGYVYTVYIENSIPVKTIHGPGCEAITGYTPDDFISDPELWYKMIYPDDRGRVILFASDIINKGVFNPIEHRIMCRDGSISWVKNTPVPLYDGDNNLVEYDSIIADITERKIAETYLKESEARYRLIIEKNPLSIFIMRNGKYIYANSAGTERLGYKYSSDVIGMDFEKTISPTGMEEITKRTIHLMNGENNSSMELTIVKADGTLHIMDSICFPINLSDGPAMLIMGQDITEQRLLEKKFLQGEFKFNALTDSSSAGIYFTDREGDCIYANRRWLEMSGLAMEEAKGKGWMKALHPDDRESIGAKWYDSVKSNGYWGFEYRFVNRQGETVWVNGTAAPIYNPDGELTGYVGTNIDITEQKKAIDNIRESEICFRNLFEHIPVAYFSLDSEGFFIDVNDHWLRLTGYSRDEVTGKSFGEFWAPETRGIFADQFKTLFAADFINNMELSLTKKNGGILTVILTGGMQTGISGEFEKMHCILTDISERKS